MMTYDYLRDHALKNVWCTPEQDNQAIFKLARITPHGGQRITSRVLWKEIDLPNTTDTWHVYQIGGVHPLILGLFPQYDEWVTFSSTCNKQKMIVDIYTTDGVELPRFDTYYRYNLDRNLIVAVKRNAKIPFDFNLDDVYLRVYTNAYFNTLRANQTTDIIHTEGLVPSTTQDILDFQNTFNTYKQKVGAIYSFVNGFRVDNIDLVTVKVGDSVEFLYDSSIYKVIDFKVGDLMEYPSLLDNKKKYLLHYAGADNGVIDYQDDIDVFVMRDLGNARYHGLYYHKNNEDALRNLTHRDYSIVVPYIVNYNRVFQKLVPNTTVLDPDDLYVRLHIRKSGYSRPLVFEHNRIHELYKLTDVDIIKAMLGIDSTVQNWRAEILELSDYTKIMRLDSCSITNEIVQSAYGYNAVSKILGDTPTKTEDYSNKKIINVPYGLQNGATAYEYDVDGKLLGWYIHDIGSRYFCFNDTAHSVELISGIGGTHLGEFYNEKNVAINNKYSYRVYECGVVSGMADNIFKDVTGTDKYKIVGNRFVWTDTNPYNYPLLRSNSKFLAYDLELDVGDGLLKFSITCLQKRENGWSNWVMHVPMGELDIFLNKKLLVKDLDYFVNFPQIIIVNKEYLDDPANKKQQIHVRHTGFCNSSLELEEYIDAGFIVHGVLSNNSIYDLRDDKVLKFSIDGQLFDRSTLDFSETTTGIDTLNPLNGKPYQIKDIVVPFRGLTTTDTYELRRRSIQVDKVVSDYLTLKLPQPPRLTPSAIVERYRVYSPFINKLTYDLDASLLALEDRVYHERDILTIVKQYEWLLAYDPTQQQRVVDDRFVIIHPHNLTYVVQLSLNNYRFLEKVVQMYCNGLVTLSPFVVVA